ncbi:MAG: hypothetical protein AAF541_19210 [Pseudomonadota bacterium]
MAEATNDPQPSTNENIQSDDTKAKDLARMRRIGGWHASAVLAAMTLFGAGSIWAAESGLLVAQLVALGNAYLAGTVMASIFHEWGHFSGAKLSGAIAPVRAKPVRFYFLFDFDMENNTARQFLWMSAGGISANWLIAIAAALLIPLNTYEGALLFAVLVGKAVNVSYFEVPIFLRTQETNNPQNELKVQLETVGLVQWPGLIAGLLVWLALV